MFGCINQKASEKEPRSPNRSDTVVTVITAPPTQRDQSRSRSNALGMKRLDNWISHLLKEGIGGKSSPPVVVEPPVIRAPPSQEWRYADDVRVTVAPLANVELEDIRRNDRRSPGRAASVLENLREQRETIDAYGERRRLQELNVVFLQANGDVKRQILPSHVVTIEQVKALFARAFPHIPRAFIDLPHVKVYIQEPSKGTLFYELDDPREIKNKSVLKLREESLSGVQSPVRFLDQSGYGSEADTADLGEISRGPRERLLGLHSLPRSASALPMDSTHFAPLTLPNHHNSAISPPPKPPHRLPTYDPYYDPYASDTSSQGDARSGTRSGSATPIIDREARVRMESMEKQLAGLTSLVASALVSKGMSESTHRDMAELRREILALHPDADPGRRSTSEERSIPESLSSHAHNQLNVIKQRLADAHNEARQLKRTVQLNAQTSRELLREASEKIATMIARRIANCTPAPVVTTDAKTAAIEEARRSHANRLTVLLDELTAFEKNVEELRASVLNSNRKLKMSEVENLTSTLTQIGRNAAALKTDFPSIQSRIEEQLKEDMARVVREEKFIRDETSTIDQSLRRCKALANIMVTMKKLAMVQDPALARGRTPRSPSDVSSTPPPNGQPPVTSMIMTSFSPVPGANGGPSGVTVSASVGPGITVSSILPPPPPIPPSPLNYSNPSTSEEQHPLDGVLEELTKNKTNGNGTLQNGGAPPLLPPKPPSRYSVADVRQKFAQPPELPPQLRAIAAQNASAPSSKAPSTPTQERRADLEERQERLAEKQRLLRAQFEQLQQLTPLP